MQAKTYTTERKWFVYVSMLVLLYMAVANLATAYTQAYRRNYTHAHILLQVKNNTWASYTKLSSYKR